MPFLSSRLACHGPSSSVWLGVGGFCLATVLFSASCSAAEPTIRAGHNLLEETVDVPVSVGSKIRELAFRDVAGKAIYLADLNAEGPVTFVFMSTRCPLVKQYTERLKRLHTEFSGEGARLIGVFSNDDETAEGIRQFAQQCKYTFPVVRDPGGYLAKNLGATMTPQAFVVSQKGELRYRGAIDDNRYANRVKQSYLRDALASVLADSPVEIEQAKSLGCSIHSDSQADEEGAVTYSRDIARILQDNCQSCHREGQVGPFALTNYREAKTWMTEIKAYTQSRLMPPWKARRGYGKFKNDQSLSSEAIDLIAKWVDQGGPLGDTEEIPPQPKFRDDWAFGEPDLIVEMPEEYVIGPEGEDDYRHFVIPYSAESDRYVEAIDVRPGNRNVVHHVIAYVDTTGEARRLDAEDPGPGYTRFGDVGFKTASVLGGWAPGSVPNKSPEATGNWLPKSCDIVLQVHYFRSGIEERDRTKIGLYFSKAKDPVAVRTNLAIDHRFKIPAGESSHEVTAERRINEPSYLFSVTPHMHLIGKTMEVWATTPDGEKHPLVQIDDWDFNWQTTYHLRDLMLLPKGSLVQLKATFDNSAENPNNPNSPPKAIFWGEKTTDEMCIAFFGTVKKSQYDSKLEDR